MAMAEPGKSFLEKAPPAASLYVHVPLCARKCKYCDFASAVYSEELAEEALTAMRRELADRAPLLARPLATVFIGGGTPTILPARLLRALLGDIAEFCNADTEFTIEANPNSLTDETLAIAIDAGINRLSIGVQSFVDSELAMLGRLHSAAEARAAVDRARTAGLTNVSVDLIYGIPGQTGKSWAYSVSTAIASGVAHASCYCLSYPPGTAIAADLAAGRIGEMDEDLQRHCYESACQMLAEAGLERYEISNFARPARRCRHNMVYWRNEPYLGIGPSAVSYIDGERIANIDSIAPYAHAVTAGDEPVASRERLTGIDLMAETAMLALRLAEGVDRESFRRRFHADISDIFPSTIGLYVDMGMLELSDDSLALTEQAVFVSDTILADLLAEAAG